MWSFADGVLAEITDDTELSSTVDYGSFPNLESSLSPPLHEILAVGPGVSVSPPAPPHPLSRTKANKTRTPAPTSPSWQSTTFPS